MDIVRQLKGQKGSRLIIQTYTLDILDVPSDTFCLTVGEIHNFGREIKIFLTVRDHLFVGYWIQKEWKVGKSE